LFAPLRPVRAEALQAGSGEASRDQAKEPTRSGLGEAGRSVLSSASTTPQFSAPLAASRGSLAQLIRAGAGRG
jgi:hypothetical protein